MRRSGVLAASLGGMRGVRFVRSTGGLLWAALRKFFEDGLSRAAAAVAYSTIFSLPALLTLVLLIVGVFADPDVVQRALLDQVSSLIGRAGADQVGTILTAARRTETRASVAATVSILTLVFGATAAFGQLQAGLNQAWDVKAQPRGNQIAAYLRKRLFSFGLVLVVAFLLLVSLAITTVLSAFGARMSTQLPGAWSEHVLQFVSTMVSFLALAFLFALMFRYLPDARVAWRDVRVGAIATALLFVIGKTVIGVYLGQSDPGSAFGAAGSLVVIMIWVYYTSMIVLYGAEVTRVWADRYGGGVRPDTGAVGVEKEEREVAKPERVVSPRP
jgi:membrane protein